MSSLRQCCTRILGQVRISRKAKRHVVRRHFLPKATGRVSVFSERLSPNYVFETATNRLRSGQLQGEIHGNCLRYHIMFNYIVGTSLNGSPSKCIRIVCTTRRCTIATCRRTLPVEIKTTYPI